MGLEQYSGQLKEVEKNFTIYRQNLNSMIDTVISSIDHTVITNGFIANATPFYHERMGNKPNGKVLQAPIISDYCMKYHYDSENRIIMIEQYSEFLDKFEIIEIYSYNTLTERLRISCEGLVVLSAFNNAFSNTQLCSIESVFIEYCGEICYNPIRKEVSYEPE